MTFRNAVIAAGLLSALTLAGCGGGPVTAECDSDSDCGEGSLCLAGRCHAELGDCRDGDGDGYRDGVACPGTETIDCDDDDPAINPGETEICGNGIDDNCLAGEDEGCPCDTVMTGATRDCGRGRCAGIQTCAATGWGECIPLIMPEQEQCGADGMGDGVDDNCNGEVDDGCLECPSRLDGMGEEIACFDDAGMASYCSSNGVCR